MRNAMLMRSAPGVQSRADAMRPPRSLSEAAAGKAIGVAPGRYRPTDKLLAFLEAL
jgi:hypothetical protein